MNSPEKSTCYEIIDNEIIVEALKYYKRSKLSKAKIKRVEDTIKQFEAWMPIEEVTNKKQKS